MVAMKETLIREVVNRIVDEVEAELKRGIEDSRYLSDGYPYYKDEEDTDLESYDQVVGIEQSPNPYIRVLKYWTNERTVVPIEWIPMILKELEKHD